MLSSFPHDVIFYRWLCFYWHRKGKIFKGPLRKTLISNSIFLLQKSNPRQSNSFQHLSPWASHQLYYFNTDLFYPRLDLWYVGNHTSWTIRIKATTLGEPYCTIFLRIFLYKYSRMSMTMSIIVYGAWRLPRAMCFAANKLVCLKLSYFSLVSRI